MAAVAVVVVAVVVVLVMVLAVVLAWCACRPHARCWRGVRVAHMRVAQSTYTLHTVYVQSTLQSTLKDAGKCTVYIKQKKGFIISVLSRYCLM